MCPTLPLMLFAAGFGTRMGQLTADRPKPLIPVAGKALIDHALDVAAGAEITRTVANLHYRADQLAAHLGPRDVALSREKDGILETGGGLKAALPLLGPGPVLTLNTDAIFTGANPLTKLMAALDADRMDVLLLTLPAHVARSATGRSDFVIDSAGRITWAKGRAGVLYLGAQIIQPHLVSSVAKAAFSLHGPWTHAIDAGRAFAITHVGDWCDVGHPDGITLAEDLILAAARHV